MTDPHRVFELRKYHAAPGRMDALLARFEDHTLDLFATHGLPVVGFWRQLDAEGRASDTLVYVLAFADRAAAVEAWDGFQHDPAWLDVKAQSEQDGPLTTSIESVFLEPTSFSPLT